jgi:hypothetical protein
MRITGQLLHRDAGGSSRVAAREQPPAAGKRRSFRRRGPLLRGNGPAEYDRCCDRLNAQYSGEPPNEEAHRSRHRAFYGALLGNPCGTQPPLIQTPPPRLTNGSGVEQALG